jgi:hypothetical protein
MAKLKIVCPFSEGLCVECSQYRGRHYYMCFYKGYPKTINRPISISNNDRRYQMPLIIHRSPKWLILDDFFERSEG